MSGYDRIQVYFSLDPIKQALAFSNRILATTPSQAMLKKQMSDNAAAAAVKGSTTATSGGMQILFWFGLAA
jgi:hypothetical protein